MSDMCPVHPRLDGRGTSARRILRGHSALREEGQREDDPLPDLNESSAQMILWEEWDPEVGLGFLSGHRGVASLRQTCQATQLLVRVRVAGFQTAQTHTRRWRAQRWHSSSVRGEWRLPRQVRDLWMVVEFPKRETPGFKSTLG